MRSAFLLFIFSTLILSGISAFGQSTVELSGKWQFYLDPQKKGLPEQWYAKKLQDTIHLPGSLQEQGYGDDVTLVQTGGMVNFLGDGGLTLFMKNIANPIM